MSRKAVRSMFDASGCMSALSLCKKSWGFVSKWGGAALSKIGIMFVQAAGPALSIMGSLLMGGV